MAPRCVAAAIAALSVGLAGCAGGGGQGSAEFAPMAVARAAQSSIATKAGSTNGARHRTRTVRRRPAVLAGSALVGLEASTPRSPSRRRKAVPSRAVALADAPRLARAACEQYAAALAGRYPDAIEARGSTRALALVSDAVAASLLGLPIVVPHRSLQARERLDAARARLVRALAADEAVAADAVARVMANRIARYARFLGISDCG